MKSVSLNESKKFHPFLRGPSILGVSSRGLGWNGFLIERHSADPGERPEAVADHYILGLVCGGPWIGEHPNGRGGYIRTPNVPGTMTLIAPGAVPAIRTREGCDHLLCALDATFVNGVEEELDRRPPETPGSRGGLTDPAMRQLTQLLANEAEQGGPTGRLYAEYLGHALVVRLLRLDAALKPDCRAVSPLPRPVLRRVLERMENLEPNIDLGSLAAESGYSRGHFLRMFRAATGCTPHHYLLQARVKRAQDLIKLGRMSLIDIAATCGFSSHAHLTRTFRQLLNVTPSEYRRKL